MRPAPCGREPCTSHVEEGVAACTVAGTASSFCTAIAFDWAVQGPPLLPLTRQRCMALALIWCVARSSPGPIAANQSGIMAFMGPSQPSSGECALQNSECNRIPHFVSITHGYILSVRVGWHHTDKWRQTGQTCLREDTGALPGKGTRAVQGCLARLTWLPGW